MKKYLIRLLSLLLIITLTSCGKFNYEISSGPNRTTIKVTDAKNDAYAEAGPISIGNNRILNITSELDKGELQIEFAEAIVTTSSDEPDDYTILDVVETIKLKPGDTLELSLTPGDYVLLLTTIGDTNGVVTIDINKSN